MTRCPNCSEWLRFEGITVRPTQPTWVRWASCDSCRRWYGTSANGAAVATSDRKPL